VLQQRRSHYWNPASCRAFVLDWDGVLAETKLNFAPIREKYFQGRFVPLFEAIATLPPSLAESLKKDIYDEEMAGAEAAEPVNGAFELLDWLHRHDIPWCVVSRNCSDSILLAAERTGLPLPPMLFSRDTPPVKPAPEALWRAAHSLDALPADCVMVGDFVYDLVGARRAGMRAVLVQRPQAEWRHWADVSFDRLTDFVAFLQTPGDLIPWEYRRLASLAGGEKRLATLAGYAASIAATHEDVLLLCLEYASKGLLNFHIEGDSMLAPIQWFNLPGLSPVWLDQPVKEVVAHLLNTRFPIARLIGETKGFLLLSQNEAFPGGEEK